MNWRARLALLFAAASPLALGHANADPLPLPHDIAVGQPPAGIDRDLWSYVDPAQRNRLLQLAGHSSHSSHASHSSHYSGSSGGGHSSHVSHSSHYSGSTGSHASHYSGSTGGSGYTSPSISSPAPSSSTTSGAATSGRRLSEDEKTSTIQKVQIALMTRGYDPGPADGVMGARTKTAIRQFQDTSNLPSTGLLDVATLRALGVIR